MADQDSGVIGVYESMEDAEAAIKRLGEGDYPVDQISIIGQNLESRTDVHGFVSTGDVASSGVSAGAWTGGIFGLLTGAAFLFVPGFGPLIVAGPLAAALLGGVQGAAVGGIAGGGIGAVIGHFVHKRHIPKYEQSVKAGSYLLVAHGDADDLGRARDLLQDTGASEVNRHEDEATATA